MPRLQFFFHRSGMLGFIGEVVVFDLDRAVILDPVQLPRPGIPSGMAAHRVVTKRGELVLETSPPLSLQ